MSIRCPDCNKMNEDGRIFCSFCGGPLDPKVRLIKDLEKEVSTARKEEPKPKKIDDDDDDYVPPVRQEKEKKNYVPLVIGLVVVLAVAAWFLLSR